MIEHVAASFRKSLEETRYRAYITDALQALTWNTTHRLIYGVGEVEHGMCIDQRWYDGTPKKEEPEMSADEIALGVIARAGLKIKEGDQP